MLNGGQGLRCEVHLTQSVSSFLFQLLIWFDSHSRALFGDRIRTLLFGSQILSQFDELKVFPEHNLVLFV